MELKLIRNKSLNLRILAVVGGIPIQMILGQSQGEVKRVVVEQKRGL